MMQAETLKLLEHICEDYHLDFNEIVNRYDLKVPTSSTRATTSRTLTECDSSSSGTTVVMEPILYDGQSYWMDRKKRVYKLDDNMQHASLLGNVVNGQIKWLVSPRC